MKRTIVAALAVFVLWVLLDYLLHGVILRTTYMATPFFWRPLPQLKRGLGYVVVLVSAACFVYVYAALIADRSLRTALTYGLVFGIGAGISMGYGSYSVMPIPYELALSWFLGTIVETVLGAWVAWVILARGAIEAGA